MNNYKYMNLSQEPEKKIEENSEDKTNKMIYIYQNLFVSSVLTIVNLLRDVGNKNKDNIPTEKKSSFDKLFVTCEEIITQYKKTEKNTDVDQVKIIKKVFKVLTANLDLVKTRNNNLFTVRTPEGKIHTIIPGLNINLCISFFTEEESNTLWESIESMFVTSVRMVYLMTDKSRHNTDVTNLTNELEQKSMKKLNNFFMGLNVINEGDTINMDQLMTSDIVIPGTEANSGFLGKLGVDKIMNPQALGDEIKKFNDDDINETVSTLTSMLGNDSDIKDVCSTMVKSVLEDIKTNGIENMFSIAERVSGKLGNKIDPEKMAKTASGMHNLINSNSDKLNELKDENGNPVGAEFLKQFQNTFNMAKMFNKK